MSKTIHEILERLDGAMKNITDTNNLGASVLTVDKFDRFIREARHRTSILDESRFFQMDAHRVEIDRIGIDGEALYSGRVPNGEHGQPRATTTDDYVMPVTATNELIARELRGDTSLNDHALRRNIERGGLENTIVDLLGGAAGRDLEKFAVFADTDFDPSGTGDDAVRQKYADTDGWLKTAEQRLYGVGGSSDFDAEDPESIFQAMLEALPKEFLGDRGDWRIWTPWEIFDAYQDVLRARGTQLGDTNQTGTPTLFYKGLPIRYAPVLDSNAATLTGVGRACMLGHPDNLAWGVFHQIQVERERNAQQRRTDWHLTVEADAGMENENAAVVALLDQEDS